MLGRLVAIVAIAGLVAGSQAMAAESRPPLLTGPQAKWNAKQILDQYYGWEWREAGYRSVRPVYRMARNKYQVEYSFDAPESEAWREGSVIVQKTWEGIFYRVLPVHRRAIALLNAERYGPPN